MISLLLCLALPLFLVHYSHAVGTSSKRFPTTSPNFCFEFDDCAPGHYCTERSRCAPRVALNGTCTDPIDECQDGLKCAENSYGLKRFCRKKDPVGTRCTPTPMVATDCIEGTFCSRSKRACSKVGGGNIGDSCAYDADCGNAPDLYCDNTKRVCRRYLKDGARCSPSRPWIQCKGFCSDSPLLPMQRICLPTVREGKPCSRDFQCQGESRSMVCDGFCIRRSRLLMRVGMACNPRRDACDSRMGLHCSRAKSNKAFVCHQFDVSEDSLCTPGSALSTCTDKWRPRECARYQGFLVSLSGRFTCSSTDGPPVKRGFKCFGRCEANTSCLLVTGVLVFAYRAAPRQGSYCVKVAGEGQTCGNKFRTQCAVGLKCGTNKKCVKGMPKQPAEVTHAGQYSQCEKLPCVPGLECVKRPEGVWFETGLGGMFGGKRTLRCRIPIVVRKEGETCYSLQYFRRTCADGLMCMLNERGRGLARCRKPFQVGTTCKTDDQCQGKLKCSSEGGGATGRCYNEKVSVPLGAPCNVSASATEKQCTVAKLNGSEKKTYCLRKGSEFVCQFGASLYQRCSPKNNVGCGSSGTVCGKYSVCMPTN